MTKKTYVFTNHDIIYIEISHDLQLAITALQTSHNLFKIRLYELENEDYTEIKIIGEHIKAKQIVQRADGKLFCIPYNDNGTFNVIFFDRDRVHQILNINKLLHLDNSTKTIEDLIEPFINCCFIDDDLLFGSLHNRNTNNHWHPRFHISAREIIDEPVSKAVLQPLNFPIKVLHDSNNDQVLIFYRQS